MLTVVITNLPVIIQHLSKLVKKSNNKTEASDDSILKNLQVLLITECPRHLVVTSYKIHIFKTIQPSNQIPHSNQVFCCIKQTYHSRTQVQVQTPILRFSSTKSHKQADQPCKLGSCKSMQWCRVRKATSESGAVLNLQTPMLRVGVHSSGCSYLWQLSNTCMLTCSAPIYLEHTTKYLTNQAVVLFSRAMNVAALISLLYAIFKGLPH